MTTPLTLASPSDVGLSAARLEWAAQVLKDEADAGQLGAAAMLVARHGRIVLHRGFGRLSGMPGALAVQPDSAFPLASITKPVTATALMLLVERGLLTLDDPVSLHLPAFTGDERGRVRVRDLLRHTSGLPDMLPENIELRRQHAPLSTFLDRACRTPLLYPPGTRYHYQSMGILLAAAIVEKLSDRPLREFEQAEIFLPLGMSQSSLGLGSRRLEDVVQTMLMPGGDPAEERSFGWNSDYWRNLGVPWGGMHSTVYDLSLLLENFLRAGAGANAKVVSPATARAMISDQNAGLTAPWGLGWALGHSMPPGNLFGDLLAPTAFGHTGASGTVAWADPASKLTCVILTNRPYALDDGRLLRRVANAVAASVET